MTVCTFHDASSEAQDRRLFEIVEAAYNRRQNVLIFAAGAERAAVIDRFLWILKQEAFIPHKIIENNQVEKDIPVVIVTGEINPNGAGMLVADGHCSLEFACEFDVVHEFVNRSTPEIHQACRDRFRNYRVRQAEVEYSK